MKRIAIISDTYVRDAQVFTGDPEIIEDDPDWEDNFHDKQPDLFVGIFDGDSEEEIQKSAAARMGVHPNVISLIEI